jgi:hypothetical protein
MVQTGCLMLDIAVRKNWGSHIDASHSRQPLVKGERLVRYEVNAVIADVISQMMCFCVISKLLLMRSSLLTQSKMQTYRIHLKNMLALIVLSGMKLATAHKQVASREILLWMTPSEAPKALQASECSELLDPMRANCWISAQH